MQKGRYIAQISGKYLGSFSTPELASSAYEDALAQKFGIPRCDSHLYTRNGRKFFNYQVDSEYKSAVDAHKWYDNGNGYGYACVDGANVYLHDFVLRLSGAHKPDGIEVDHIDRNKENNTLSNLRLTTRSGNSLNRFSVNVRKRRDMKSFEVRVVVSGMLFRRIFESEQVAVSWAREIKDSAISESSVSEA